MPAELILLTRHAKSEAVAVPLAAAGYEVREYAAFDTDTLGTFTGDIPRAGTQYEAALRKAQLAAALGDGRYGLGSEGSFGPDPYLGIRSWGLELLVWWDAERSYAVQGVAQGPDTNYAFADCESLEAVRDFAAKVGFPQHGLITGRPGEAVFRKDFDSTAALEAWTAPHLAASPVWLSTDMRAQRNPTRLAMIARAAWQLSHRLQTACPSCKAPGFGEIRLEPGAFCSLCGTPTRAARAEIHTCPCCRHSERRPLRDSIDPSRCDVCNP